MLPSPLTFPRVLLTLTLLLAVPPGSADLFTGTDGLRSLSAVEEDVLTDLHKVVTSLEDRIHLMKLILADLSYSHRDWAADPLSLAGHPVHAYNLIKRWRHLQMLFSPQTPDTAEDTNIPVDADCDDDHTNCSLWAQIGECEKNPNYMLFNCRLACQQCLLPVREVTDQTLVDLQAAVRTRIPNPLPTEEDYSGAAQGLVRLQRTYRLSTEQLIAGDIRGRRSARPLLPEDCFTLGRAAVSAGEWGIALQWLGRAEGRRADHSAELRLLMAQAYVGVKDYTRANQTLRDAFGGTLPVLQEGHMCVDRNESCQEWAKKGECENNPPFMLQYCTFSCKICDTIYKERFPGEYELTNIYYKLNQEVLHLGPVDEVANAPASDGMLRAPTPDWKPVYEQLCRGEGQNNYTGALCRYRPALLPWNVYKEEVLVLNPRIALVYDVITDTEADMLRHRAKHVMARGRVGSDKRVSDDRVSKVGWLLDADPEIKRLSERVELITGLEATHTDRGPDGKTRISADAFQAVNYGIGGHYEPHTDYFQDKKEDLDKTEIGSLISVSGDRIATFLFYLTDVEAGGGTVYPEVKIQVPPVKNAAAFWFNSRLSGDYDPLTLHAGCPVLLGEKWVCNKWIREFGNEFTRKCGLTEADKYHT